MTVDNQFSSAIFSGSFKTDIQSNGQIIQRTCSIGDDVDCYRNLNKPAYFSIRQRKGADKGKIAGYAKAVIIANPVIVVSESSRQRVLREQRKNVHAFIRGSLFGAAENLADVIGNAQRVITYSPYVADTFFDRETNVLITGELPRYAVLFGANVYLFEEDVFTTALMEAA